MRRDVVCAHWANPNRCTPDHVSILRALPRHIAPHLHILPRHNNPTTCPYAISYEYRACCALKPKHSSMEPFTFVIVSHVFPFSKRHSGNPPSVGGSITRSSYQERYSN